MTEPITDVERSVRERYSQAADTQEPALCCRVDYKPELLDAIPQEILDKDYGCGDPSRYVRPGDAVLDLGSGGGKICYIASQIVGADGSVTGVDMNDDMLELAERHRDAVGNTIGHHNVRFVKGKIQDLALDVRGLEQRLRENPPHDFVSYEAHQRWADAQRRNNPLVASDSIDIVVSNCVLNLVRREDRLHMFGEIHRVLREEGRAVISDIVADQDVPIELQNDPELWSGCISGAFREDLFVEAFQQAGFDEVEIIDRDANPWQVVAGIDFRSVTVEARKRAGTAKRSCC